MNPIPNGIANTLLCLSPKSGEKLRESNIKFQKYSFSLMPDFVAMLGKNQIASNFSMHDSNNDNFGTFKNTIMRAEYNPVPLSVSLLLPIPSLQPRLALSVLSGGIDESTRDRQGNKETAGFLK
jgi:hypothetical protein